MNKTYAFTDLHGIYSLWEQIRDYCDKNDTLYFLGDAIDRGHDGIKIMKEMLFDKRVIYLIGNHEEMMLDTIPYYIPSLDNFIDPHYSMEWIWLSNGGHYTLEDFKKESNETKEYIYIKLKNLKDHTTYINKNNQIIYLCHSGTQFNYKEYWSICKYHNYNHYLWDRYHFNKPWEKDENSFMVHGHTPVHYICLEEALTPDLTKDGDINILRYCNNHKIDLDLLSIESKRAALFNLDTLQVEQYFTVKEEKENE